MPACYELQPDEFKNPRHGLCNQIRKFHDRLKRKKTQKNQAIAELRWVANNIRLELNNGKTPTTYRADFGNAQRGKRRKVLRVPCVACNDHPAQCRHHLVQLQNGGHNGKTNVVGLCHPCHAEVHPWLNKTPATMRTRPNPGEAKAQRDTWPDRDDDGTTHGPSGLTVGIKQRER